MIWHWARGGAFCCACRCLVCGMEVGCHFEVGWWRRGDKGGWRRRAPAVQWEANDVSLTVCQIGGVAVSATGSHLRDLL